MHATREWIKCTCETLVLWLPWVVSAYFGLVSFLCDGRAVRRTIVVLWQKGVSGRILEVKLRSVVEALSPGAVGVDVYWFVGGVILALLYVGVSIAGSRIKRANDNRRENEIQNYINQNEELKREIVQETDECRRLKRTVARYDFFRVNLGLLIRWYMTYIWRDLHLGSNERMTLYRFDGKLKSLIIVDRHSEHLGFRQIGRDVLVAEDCVLTRAWKMGVVYCGDLPNPQTAPKRYKARQRDLGCKGGVLQAFKMLPRTYFAWRVSDDGGRDPVAVVMVESICEQFSNQNSLVAGLKNHREFLYMFVRNFGMEMPCLPVAEKAGF